MTLVFLLVYIFLNLFNFTPLFLIAHCFFIFIFKKWLGPIATFYASVFVFFFVFFFNSLEFYVNNLFGGYFFIDFGRWFFCLDLIDSHLLFCVDNLALLTSLLVLLLTCLALYFGVEYMYRESFINRLLYLLNMFATSVILLFFCYDFFLIILIWECIGLFSFLLVNFYSIRIYTIKASLKTFVFSRISDMFMFFSFMLSILIFNTTDLSLIFLQTPFLSFHYFFIGNYAFHFLTLFSFCLSTSGVIKAAQFFFHVWLPDAMEAPTPASALIHSSTLVVAGVFLIIRFSIVFEFTPFTNYFLSILGASTLAFGSVTAIFQNDIKKLVAYSTISQIGYLVCGCGFCCYEETLLYLIMHALNKAFLFILVGYIVHFFNGNTDLRQMGGSYLYSFDITVFLFGVSLNLAGLPYTAGFLAKEFLVFQVLKDDFFSMFIRSFWLISFFFTPIYMLMLLFFSTFGPKKSTITSYSGFWKYKPLYNNFLNHSSFLIFFQFTSKTSLFTSLILFLFWLIFFFFGENFLLFLFEFSSFQEIIPGSYFLSIKNFTIYNYFLISNSLHSSLTFFIFFFFFSAVFYLIKLKKNNFHGFIDTTSIFFFLLIFLLFI